MRHFLTISLMAIILTFATLAQAMDITLQWDQNQEPDLAGYKIYYDTDNSMPPYEGDGSPMIITTMDDLNPLPGIVEHTITLSNQDHWICVTAYDTEGLESGYSNVVTTQHWPPGPPSTPGSIKIKMIIMVEVK